MGNFQICKRKLLKVQERAQMHEQTIKLLKKKKIGQSFMTEFGNNFWDMNQKHRQQKKKIDKFDNTKI